MMTNNHPNKSFFIQINWKIVDIPFDIISHGGRDNR